jgi:hypothetical protein
MENLGFKITSRDFFVYLICGYISLILTMPLFLFHNDKYLNAPTYLNGIDGYMYIIMFILSLPAFYLFGHILQQLDSYTKYINGSFFNGHKITYLINSDCNEEDLNEESFWIRCNYLMLNHHYENSEFSYIKKDFCAGIFIFAFILSVVSLFIGIYYCDKLYFIYSVILIFISLIMKSRAAFFARNFIRNINRSYNLLNGE